jgi:glycosyltransferase involved in cell wall biosynthesis
MMRVVILSWEFPPRVVGQLAEHVKELSVRLVKSGVETHVVTYHDYLTGPFQEADGVGIVRVTNPVRTHIGVLTWVLTLNQEVERVTANIYYDASKQVDLIDAHDWHFIPAAVTLKKALNVPFVFSVESLEEHRSHGANYPFNMAIKSIEWLGMYEAARLVVKSDWMRDEVVRIYKVPTEKIEVISPKSNHWHETVLDIYKSVGGSEPR